MTDLRSTRARLDGILGALAEAVTVHDEHGQTIYANAAAARLLGREVADDVTAAKPGELGARFAITREDGSPVAIDGPARPAADGGRGGARALTRSVDLDERRGVLAADQGDVLHDRGRPLAVNIIEDVTDAKEAELRQRFLAEAGQLLASSLDYEETLAARRDARRPVAGRLVRGRPPRRARRHHQVALAHADPAKIALAERLRERYPPDPDATTASRASRRAAAELFRESPTSCSTRRSSDPEQLDASASSACGR